MVSPFIKNIIKLGSANAIVQVLAVIVSPVLTRLYAPSSFGELGVFVSIFGMILPFMGFKYENAIVMAKSKLEAKNLYIITLVITLSVALFIFGVFWLFWQKISFTSDIDIKFYLVLAAPLLFLFHGINQINLQYLNFHSSYNMISTAVIISRVSGSSSKIILGLQNLSFNGLIVGEFINRIISSIFTLIGVIKTKSLHVESKLNISQVKKTLSDYHKFPKYELPLDILNTYALRLPIILIALYFNNTIVGYYTFTEALFLKFIQLFSKSIGRVYYKEIATYNFDHMQKKTTVLIELLIILGAFPFIVVMFFGHDIFYYVFGNDWGEAGLYAQILSPYMFVFFLQKPINSIYRVLNMQEKAFYINILFIILFLSSVFVGGKILGNDILTFSFISFSGILIFGGLLIYSLIKIKLNLTSLGIFAGKLIGFSLLVLLPVFVLKFYFNNDLGLLFILISALIFYYYFYKKEYFKRLKEI